MRSLVYDELYIGGRWQSPSTGQRLSVISPHSEEPIGETPEAAPVGCRQGGDGRQRSRSTTGRGLGSRPSERMEKVEKLAAVYSGHTDEMADLITAEMGSPRSFSRLGQATAAVAQMHLNLATAREFPWVERQPGSVRGGARAPRPRRRRRRDRAVECTAVPDHAEAHTRR